jgi:hypothetical protein
VGAEQATESTAGRPNHWLDFDFICGILPVNHVQAFQVRICQGQHVSKGSTNILCSQALKEQVVL